ncbi:MAG: dihydroneopterin aldolase [Patescibacteria group bacterium]
MNNSSYLEVKDLTLMCRLGVTDAERSYKQKIFVTLRIYGDFNLPMESDEVVDTIDYTHVVDSIESLVQKETFKLIEHLAYRIREVILGVCENRLIEVYVVKPNVLRNARYASFTLH